jgi:tetratricopeptide (TPR) repeat protein
MMAVLGALPVYYAFHQRSYALGALSAAFFLAAIISSVPVMRPWEYFNEFAGGTAGAHKYFSDEGVDLGLRLKEISAYYEQNLKPEGDVPFLAYFSSSVERRRRGMDWVGKELERDEPRLASDTFSGTFIIGGPELTPKLWWDVAKPLRDAQPVARMGNVFVFRGSFPRPPGAVARTLYYRAIYGNLYTPEPDVPAAIEMLQKSAELDPHAFHVSLELGNQYLKLGNREQALAAYSHSLEYAPRTDGIHSLLRQQVELLKNGATDIQQIRNPGVE